MVSMSMTVEKIKGRQPETQVDGASVSYGVASLFAPCLPSASMNVLETRKDKQCAGMHSETRIIINRITTAQQRKRSEAVAVLIVNSLLEDLLLAHHRRD